MIDLARQFKDSDAGPRTIRRQIAAVKDRIDPRAVILLDEFYLKAVRPSVKGGSAFAGVFNDSGLLAYHSINKMTANPAYKAPSLSFDQLTPAMQSFYNRREDERQDFWADIKINWDNVWPFGKTMLVPKGQRATMEKMCRDFIYEQPPRQRQYHGVVLGDVLWLLHLRSKFQVGNKGLISDFQRSEQTALFLGQGREVLKFWENVAGLDDYNPVLGTKPAIRDYSVLGQEFGMMIRYGWPGYHPGAKKEANTPS